MIQTILCSILLMFDARLRTMSRKFPGDSDIATNTYGIINSNVPLVGYLKEIVFVRWFASLAFLLFFYEINIIQEINGIVYRFWKTLLLGHVLILSNTSSECNLACLSW